MKTIIFLAAWTLAWVLLSCDAAPRAPYSCRVVGEVQCVATKQCVRCALRATTGHRMNQYCISAPIMTGDTVCGYWQ